MAWDWGVWKSRNRNRNRNFKNWDRVEIKFKMASSVIIVLRNFQHSDRDTKDVLTFGYLVHACVLLYQTCLHITLRHFYQKKQTNKQNIQL